jgi:hypothetical protein
MRRFISFCIAVLLLSGCASDLDVKLKTFRQNEHNLPEVGRFRYLGAQWKMSKWFEKIDSMDYQSYQLQSSILSNQRAMYGIESMNTYVTVERFQKNQLSNYQYFNQATTLLKALTQHYRVSLESSNNSDLYNYHFDNSEPTAFKTTHGYEGLIFQAEMTNKYQNSTTSGMYAFLKRKDAYWVVKIHATKYSMNYLADDFMKIIYSFD